MDRWIGRILWTLLGVTLSLPLIYLAILTTLALLPGYSWREMDWNDDGHTSVGEFLDTADTFERDTTVKGQRCVEIVAMKDGLPLRTHCPAR